MAKMEELLRELLDTGDVVADEADEDGLGGRLAVDPVFDVVAVGVALAHFVFGFADSGDDFFAVHAHDRLALLNGLLHFGREGVEPLHRGGTLPGEIEKRRKQLFQVVRAEIGDGLVEFEKNGAAHARLHAGRAGLLLLRGALHGGSGAGHINVQMIAPAPFAAPATVDVHDDLVITKIEPRNLHLVAGVDGRAVGGDGAIQQFLIDRFSGVGQETLLARGKRLDGLGKFTGNVTKQGELGSLFERRIFRGGIRRFAVRLVLRLRLRGICRRFVVWQDGNLIAWRKVWNRVGGRAKTVDAWNVRIRQERKQQHKCQPVRHEDPRAAKRPTSLLYDAGRRLNR